MANSVKADEYRRVFKDVSVAYGLAAATDPDRTPLITCANSKHRLYIQRIAVHVITAAAQAITFAGSGATGTIAVLPASAAAGDVHVLLDLADGIGLADGEHLNVSGTAGVAGTITVEGYERLAPGAVVLPSEL